MLLQIRSGVDLTYYRKDSKRIDNLYHTLLRKSLISEEEKLTSIGEELIKFLESPSKALIIPKASIDDFERWWKAFPATDVFEINGKQFTGCRSFKMRKTDCKMKLSQILLEKEYTIDELIDALNLEIDLKKEQSYKLKDNKLKFLQNTYTYLNQRSFESYIEMIRNGKKVRIKPVKSDLTTDI